MGAYKKHSLCGVRRGRLAFAATELLIAVILVLVLGVIGVREYRLADTATEVAQVRRDFRSISTAIGAYYVDNNSYPASTNVGYHSIYSQFASTGKLQDCRTFKLRLFVVSSTLNTLTTPIAYLTAYPPDPFADTTGATYPYWSVRSGWIVGSWGPDRDQKTGGQLNWCGGVFHVARGGAATNPGFNPGVEMVYDPVNESQPSPTLIAGGGIGGAYTYDPTNGTVSAGDLWRVKGQVDPPPQGAGMMTY